MGAQYQSQNTKVVPTEATDKKCIAVMGATGNQGGAVVKALLTAPEEFTIRVITRKPDCDKAKALAAQGLEVIQADSDDEASMVAALTGVYGAFLVTTWWEHMSIAREIEQTDKLQKAAMKANVAHVVLTSFEDTRPIINASENKASWPVLDKALQSFVPQLDAKGEAGSRFLASSVPTTLLFTSFYYENFISLGMGPKKYAEDQPLSVTFPTGDKPFAMVTLKDIGDTVLAIFRDPSTINTIVGVVSAYHSGQEIADAFSSAMGQPVVYNSVDTATYASFGFPGAAELASMFRFFVEFKPVHRDVGKTEKMLGRETDKLATWIEENKEAFS